jgi:hypothetical protein
VRLPHMDEGYMFIFSLCAKKALLRPIKNSAQTVCGQPWIGSCLFVEMESTLRKVMTNYYSGPLSGR